ncbi:uncharacterized protein LOC100277162 [Zea mays]|uniref:DUF3143 family protein n=1 Tax=Zea mays TaxID=4577 RepID=A0A1D6MD98_MAIZE|nr:uncharacterized protein LOC100277162 [Zea mays]AQK88641.1 DUF3143 family protein [Zea mays]|eukprot:NP_001144282.2 uncharacterized protein LOC100277162 [Zea mays]
MSMALSSSLRGLVALTPLALPSARPSGAAAAAPAPRARGRTGRGAGVVALAAALPSDAQWLERLPEKKKPLYTHSLPCIEAWLRSLGFTQSREDPAVWVAEKPLWHARLSLDVTDLHIRYLKSGPGNLDKDMERRFSYALSREDIENAILGGP